ncbi:MAG: hypothetical protein ACI8T1_001143, partial [Verrucomicrobiales bacterium]
LREGGNRERKDKGAALRRMAKATVSETRRRG